MSFYLRPPAGRISLCQLEEFAVHRLTFLIDLLNDREKNKRHNCGTALNLERVAFSECLIEGTQKDIISHFILRLCLADDKEAALFLLQAEGELFRHRLDCFTERELYRFLKTSEAELLKINEKHSHDLTYHLLTTLLKIKQNLDWRQIAKLHHKLTSGELLHNLTSGELQQNLTSGKTFSVPFTAALSLVAKRAVVLHNGQASVPYSFLYEVLNQCNSDFLRRGIKDSHGKVEEDDVRIKRLSRKLKHIFHRRMSPHFNHIGEYGCVGADEVERASELFPPCMKHLYKQLRESHRLRHNARIQLTLFLKEIGMPVHEALQFWRSEYSHPSTGGAVGCQHHWSSNAKRYTYNIRHLYGLEGSKVNYRSHCCISLQGYSPTPGDCGGCPFRLSDREHLTDLLNKERCDAATTEEILELCNRGNYSAACGRLLDTKEKELQERKRNSDLTETRNEFVGDNMELAEMAKKHNHEHVPTTGEEESCEHQDVLLGSREFRSACEQSSEHQDVNLESHELRSTCYRKCDSKCYDHDLCLSQLCGSQEVKDEYTENVTLLAKPAEFYFKLKNLANGIT